MTSRKSALLIATDRYLDDRLSGLPSVSSDVDQLEGVLADPLVGGYQVHQVHNKSASQINLALEDFFMDAGFDDILLIYVSGHGLKDDSGRLFFAVSDTRINRLASSAVSSVFVHELMNHSRARRIMVVLDCCYAGEFTKAGVRRSVDRADVLERLSARGRAVLASSTALQYSYEGSIVSTDEISAKESRTASSFTNYLVEGLRTGEADLNNDGLIEVSELYEYVHQKMRVAPALQTPVFSSELEGPLYIAYSRRGRGSRREPLTETELEGGSATATDDGRGVSVRLDQDGHLEMLVGRRNFLVAGSALLIKSRHVGGGQWAIDLSTLGENHQRFSEFVRLNWPGVGLAQPFDTYESDWLLSIPGANAFDGALLAVQIHAYSEVTAGAREVSGTAIQRMERFIRAPYRGLIVSGELDGQGESYFTAIDKFEARRQIRQRSQVRIPSAYLLDDLTYGVLWAAANLDESLQSDEMGLAESRRRLRSYGTLPGSAVSREVASDLTMVSQMWLGSDFCARYIVGRLESWRDAPLYWTREKSGEEACMWLLVRHKFDYLRKTGRKFVSSQEPSIRVFCIPTDELQKASSSDRTLIFLAVALMEMLGIEIRVCIDPAYLEMEGFVLDTRRRGMIANWVRGQGIWHVDSLGRGAKVNEFNDAVKCSSVHSVMSGVTPPQRLRSLADYLDLDWAWIRSRCRDLGEAGWSGLVAPRSRLLGVEALDAVCRYVGKLD
jgi:hypothetical protein